jgi:hypothetical protein
VSAPVEVPPGVLERIRAMCLALPEVTARVDVPTQPGRTPAVVPPRLISAETRTWGTGAET